MELFYNSEKNQRHPELTKTPEESQFGPENTKILNSSKSQRQLIRQQKTDKTGYNLQSYVAQHVKIQRELQYKFDKRAAKKA